MARELKNSYLEGERQLKDYQLEQARQKSLENLKIYGLDVTNGVGNLNFISKMKNSLNLDPNYPYKLDKFDDYSMELFLALKDFQRNKGLPVTGVLDIETLIAFDKTYPYSFNDQEKARLLNYYQGKNNFISEKGKVVTESTKVEIAKSEANLVSDNLSIPKNEALLKAKNNLNLSGSVTEMQNQILIIQKQYKITEDGKINNEILEIITLKEYFLKENQNAVEQNALSKEYQEKTLETLAKYPLTSELNISLVAFNNNIMKPKLQTNPNFDQEYKEFYTKIESKAVEYTNSPEGQQNLKEAESNGATLYEVIKDPNTNMAEKVKAVATNPILLTGAGILFLFGSFGTGTKLTDAWWKRLLVILGLTTLGPDAIKGLGLDKAYDDFGKNISSTTSQVKTGVDNGKTERDAQAKEVENFIVRNSNDGADWVSKKADEFVSGIDKPKDSKKVDKKAVEDKIINSTNTVLSSMNTKNENLKKSKDETEKQKYIESKTFKLFAENITKDETFGNKLTSEVLVVKDDASKIKEFLTKETKEKIFPKNLDDTQVKQRNKDLVNYVNLLLDEKKSGDVYMKDIYIKDKGFMDSLADTLTETMNYDYFKDNEQLNDKVKSKISSLSSDHKNSIAYDLSTIIGSEDNGAKANKIVEYLNDKSKKFTSEDKKILEDLKNIFLIKYNLDKFSEELNKIDVNGGKDSLNKINTIIEKYDKTIKGLPSKLDDETKAIFLSIIRDRRSTVELKIFENTPELKNDNVYKDRFSLLENENKFNDSILKIKDLPKNRTLEEYEKYITEENMLAYDDVIKVYEKHYKDAKDEKTGKLKEYWTNRGLSLDEKGVISFNKSKVKKGVTLNDNDEKTIDILTKGSEIKNRYDALVSNLGFIINAEKENVKKLTGKINANNNPENFKANFATYSLKMQSIFDRLYPNNKPKDINDINGWIGYLNQGNKSSVLGELIGRLKIVDNTIEINDSELMTSITGLKETLNKKTGLVNETMKGDKWKDKLAGNPKLFGDYKAFYEAATGSLPDFLKQSLVNPEDDKINKMTLEELKNYLNIFSEKVSAYNENVSIFNKGKGEKDKIEPINIDNFKTQYVTLSNNLKNYINGPKIQQN